MPPRPWTYRKRQEEELVEEDRVVESSPRSDGFPDLPEEGKASRQAPGSPPSQTHVELPGSKPSCPQAQHHSSWAVTCVTTHSAPFPLPLPQPHSLQRLRKVREPRSLLSVGLSIRGGNQPVYSFITSSNKYLLILNYRASTSGPQK